jgi:hypothetical protein
MPDFTPRDVKLGVLLYFLSTSDFMQHHFYYGNP